MFEKKKRPLDTLVWLFAFKIVSSLTILFLIAFVIDVTRLIHWIRAYVG